jgi:hypothetical protein
MAAAFSVGETGGSGVGDGSTAGVIVGNGSATTTSLVGGGVPVDEVVQVIIFKEHRAIDKRSLLVSIILNSKKWNESIIDDFNVC